MVMIDMPMPKNCCNCPFAIADLINGIITLSCMTQTGRRMYAPGLINEKNRPVWCPLKEQEATQKDGYNLQELWKRARAGETLNETELNFLLAYWDERNIFKQQEEGRLKEQEAKCLTKAELDDLNENQFVWFEGRTGYLYCLQIIGICRGRTGVSDIQFNAPTSYVERSTNTYGKTYRIWTNKPTEEQSQAVKWE